MDASIPFRALFLLSLALPFAAQACMKEGEMIVFYCEAMQGKKFIELCSTDLDQDTGYLVYRFGDLDEHQSEGAVELEYPSKTEGSLKLFFGAEYQGQHTVRFVSGGYDYIVFSRPDLKLAAKEPMEGEVREEGGSYESGIEVRDRKTKKVSTIYCSEAPASYTHRLKGYIACDKETPVGEACID
jgi:hypothetical protein